MARLPAAEPGAGHLPHEGRAQHQGRGPPLRVPRRAHDVRLAPRAPVGQHTAQQQPRVHRAQARSQEDRSRLRVLHRMSLPVLSERASVKLDAYIVDIAWSRDGKTIAVAGGEGAVALVESSADKPQVRVLGEHGMGTIAVAWQPGAQRLASSGQDGAVVLWNISDPGASKRLRPGTGWTEHIAYSPDGKLLATATGKVLSLWDGAGELVHKYEPLPATIAALTWDKPGRDLAAA